MATVGVWSEVRGEVEREVRRMEVAVAPDRGARPRRSGDGDVEEPEKGVDDLGPEVLTGRGEETLDEDATPCQRHAPRGVDQSARGSRPVKPARRSASAACRRSPT